MGKKGKVNFDLNGSINVYMGNIDTANAVTESGRNHLAEAMEHVSKSDMMHNMTFTKKKPYIKVIDTFKLQRHMEQNQEKTLEGLETIKEKYGIEDMSDIPVDKAKILLKDGFTMSHKYFSHGEYVMQRNFTMIFEDGCRIDETTFWKDRQCIGFETGWRLF